MNISMLLDMAASGSPDRLALGPARSGTTYARLQRQARAGAAIIARAGASRLVFVAGNDELFPTTLFATALAGVPIVPLNYRLGRSQLAELLAEQPEGALVVCDPRYRAVAAGSGAALRTTDQWWTEIDAAAESDGDAVPDLADPAGDGVAVLLYTSGTSAAPKAAVLRHRHLTSYILGSVEFGSAAATDATLVTVPPYHIAGIANALSNVYAGRRIVYLDRFDPAEWLQLATAEGVTNAMLVPTMLARIVQYLDRDGSAAGPVPAVRTLAYGGARMPLPVIERALALFPETGFVNAYGLTETSSTIAVLSPEDHRGAVASEDPQVRARLASAGRPVPGLEVEIRDDSGAPVASGQAGELWVRGPQVSGEYAGGGSGTDADGWFATKDLARFDADGYLFVEGRLDDTIIRGGENISPADIEDVILRHPAVAECAVVGVPDEEWGQRLVAAVVPRSDDGVDVAELREWLAAQLRSSKTPDEVRVWTELPQTDTGKIVRRQVLQRFLDEPSGQAADEVGAPA